MIKALKYIHGKLWWMNSVWVVILLLPFIFSSKYIAVKHLTALAPSDFFVVMLPHFHIQATNLDCTVIFFMMEMMAKTKDKLHETKISL